MRPRTEIPAAQVGAIRRAMLTATTTSAFQRLQCLWLRARQNLSTGMIAQTVGLSVSHVRRVWSDYLREGLAGAKGRPKGGRRHQNLTVTQEQDVLAPMEKRSPGREAGYRPRDQNPLRKDRRPRRPRLDGLSAAGPPPLAAGDAPPQTPQGQSARPLGF